MARLTLIAALLLAGCASEPPVIKVPVVERAVPPAELLIPIPKPGPIFKPPSTSSLACLDAAGKDALVFHIDALWQRLDAWTAWAAP